MVFCPHKRQWHIFGTTKGSLSEIWNVSLQCDFFFLFFLVKLHIAFKEIRWVVYKFCWIFQFSGVREVACPQLFQVSRSQIIGETLGTAITLEYGIWVQFQVCSHCQVFTLFIAEYCGPIASLSHSRIEYQIWQIY